MKKINNNDIINLRSFLLESENSSTFKRSNLTHFKTLDNVYLWTNESLKDFYRGNAIGKTAFTVTSSGDHPIHASLAGAREIHMFDVNNLSKYSASIKVLMFINSNYDDFYKQMSNLEQSKLDPMLNKIGDMSHPNELAFWEEYQRLYRECHKSLFITGGKCNHRNNAYFDERIFYEAKECLSKSTITYHDIAAEDLSKELGNVKADRIYLSNILGRIERGYSEVHGVAVELIKKFGDMLNPGGEIYDYVLNVEMHECYTDEEIEQSFDISSKLIKPIKDIVYIYTKKDDQNNS